MKGIFKKLILSAFLFVAVLLVNQSSIYAKELTVGKTTVQVMLSDSVKHNAMLKVGDTSPKFSYTYNGNYGKVKSVEWSSSNTSIVKIKTSKNAETCIIKGVKEGHAVLTLKVKVKDGQDYTIEQVGISVYTDISDVYGEGIAQPYTCMYRGATNTSYEVNAQICKDTPGNYYKIKYQCGSFYYVSKEDGSNSGFINKSAIKTPILCKKINVYNGDFKMKIGTESRIRIQSIEPSCAANQTVNWESVNSKVAEIDQQGVVKAVAPGETTIFIRSNDKGAYKAVHIKVTPIKAWDELAFGFGNNTTKKLYEEAVDTTTGKFTDVVNKKLQVFGSGIILDYTSSFQPKPGNCHGISCASILLNAKESSLTSTLFGKNSIRNLNMTDKVNYNDCPYKLGDIITFYQCLQIEKQKECFQTVAKLAKEANTNGKTFIFGEGGHSVVVYGYEEGNSYDKVLIYDSNYANDEKHIKVYTKDGNITYWEYNPDNTGTAIYDGNANKVINVTTEDKIISDFKTRFLYHYISFEKVLKEELKYDYEYKDGIISKETDKWIFKYDENKSKACITNKNGSPTLIFEIDINKYHKNFISNYTNTASDLNANIDCNCTLDENNIQYRVITPIKKPSTAMAGINYILDYNDNESIVRGLLNEFRKSGIFEYNSKIYQYIGYIIG